MENKEGKTLYVFVYDSVKVSDKYKEKGTYTELVEKPAFVVFVDSVLSNLFAGIQNFARPPTVLNINLVSSLTMPI